MISKPTYRDMLVVVSIILHCLLSIGISVPLTCEELTQPLDKLDPQQFKGSWAFIAGSLNHMPSIEALRQRDSITAHFYNSSETSSFSYTQINRFGDRCQYLPYNISVAGGSFTFDVGNRFNLSGSFLHTSCPDCMVMHWVVKSKKRESVDLYLLSRRREVEEEEMESFRAQLRCLDLPAPVVMDPTKELCPEQPLSQPKFGQEETTEEAKS